MPGDAGTDATDRQLSAITLCTCVLRVNKVMKINATKYKCLELTTHKMTQHSKTGKKKQKNSGSKYRLQHRANKSSEHNVCLGYSPHVCILHLEAISKRVEKQYWQESVTVSRHGIFPMLEIG